MKKRLAIFSCLIAFGFSAMAQTVPQVIPALQSWEGKKGKLELPENGRIVIDPACAEVLEDAGYMLAEDLKTMFGMEYERVAGKAKAGDIYMTLNDKDSEYGDESYRLKIGSYVSISAPTAKRWEGSPPAAKRRIHCTPSSAMAIAVTKTVAASTKRLFMLYLLTAAA